ncbi:Pimeloyl-ACP methyl ester carboxylesterase [Filimonas lacunae]|uniref:Pimeloyl-ACP methyl ester carboxylesterase n=1 Tax=Filimonas lacunae TaxID=477680 RepID=A0A173MBP9_9BACT|nr:alpha/beta hydrolase [Filimonas lacunae]BAV04911.1 salicylate esterase [Filimonas lacunae]SIT33815.1 Pimeloyl-ACP methyl ester carboxylesterase [Filimonas lacunae]
MKAIYVAFVLCLVGHYSFSQQAASKIPATIVLVHGAWSDSTAWNAITPVLRDKGHTVINVNLPGHGADNTSPANISMRLYVDEVKKAIGNRTDIVLVGHSMAGVIISQVAEEIPAQVKELVYLAAFLPQDGQSLLSLAQNDKDAHLGKYLTVDKEHGLAIVSKEGITDAFLQDTPGNIVDFVIAHWKAEPLAPLATPVTLTNANFGSIRKAYIHTTEDHAVSYSAQIQMVKATPVKKTYTLHSSHTPFLSVPAKLADILLQESR